MKELNRPGARWAALIVWAALIFFMSAQSNLPTPPAPGFDKWEHAATYALLAFLLARAWFPRLRRRKPAVRWGLVVLAVFGYGILDEVHQAFVPNRSSDVRDWVADTVGGALGVAAVAISLRVRGSRASIPRSPGEVP